MDVDSRPKELPTSPLPIGELGDTWRELIGGALEAQKTAYAPYSRFMVGSAVEDQQGRIFTGCNVENASYSAAICAERTAIVKLVSAGGRGIRRIVVVTTGEEPCFPCGVCLQVIAEFGAFAEIVAIDRHASVFRKFSLRQLLPQSFGKQQLDGAGNA